MAWEIQTGALYETRGARWGGDERRVQKEGISVYKKNHNNDNNNK